MVEIDECTSAGRKVFLQIHPLIGCGGGSLPVMVMLVHLGTHKYKYTKNLQSGASSLAKHGGAYFLAVCRSIQDPIAAPEPYGNQEP